MPNPPAFERTLERDAGQPLGWAVGLGVAPKEGLGRCLNEAGPRQSQPAASMGTCVGHTTTAHLSHLCSLVNSCTRFSCVFGRCQHPHAQRPPRTSSSTSPSQWIPDTHTKTFLMPHSFPFCFNICARSVVVPRPNRFCVGACRLQPSLVKWFPTSPTCPSKCPRASTKGTKPQWTLVTCFRFCVNKVWRRWKVSFWC